MLALPQTLLELLRARRTLIVPTRQRAAAVRAAHGAAEVSAGRRAWRAPEILPWSAFVARELERGAHAFGYRLRLLQPLEEWLLWREAAMEASRDHALLRPGDLARSSARATAQMDAWGITATGAGEEGALLQAILGLFRQRCRDLHAISPSDPLTWPANLWPSAEQTWLAGIEDVGPVWEQRLALSGGRRFAAEDATPLAVPQVLACTDSTQELALAARWCSDWLRRDAEARLLLVVPHLDRVRAGLLRALDGELMQQQLLSTLAEFDTPYSIEGGVPLTDHALARHAALLLQFGAGGLDFDELGEWLRSAYMGLSDRAQRSRLELWMREQQITFLDADMLLRLLPPIERSFGAAIVAGLRTLALQFVQAQRTVQDPARWAQFFASSLESAGWPGPGVLSGEEQQLRVAVEDALGELAMLTGDIRWRLADATQALTARLRETRFEAANPDAAVTISADPGDPLVRYDAIRVCGLSADRWPAAAAAHPLLPVSAQLAAGIPQASAAGQLQRARRSLQGWRLATTSLVLSYARIEDDVVQEPSPLLHAFGVVSAPTVPRSTLLTALRGSSRTERYRQAQGRPWNTTQPLPAGTRSLQLQSECPYHAYAELRLDAKPLDEPTPGIDVRLRGNVLHIALEFFWRAVRDQATLRLLPATHLSTLRHDAIQYALRRQLQRRALPPDDDSVRREAARCTRLLDAVLEWDGTRAPFSVSGLESERQLKLRQALVHVRLDRVDTLVDDALLVLDYKTGKGAAFAAEEPRLSRVQLPAYALVAGDAVAGVATVHVRPDGVSVRGVADTAARLPRLPESPLPWDELLTRWRAQLQTLADEFVAGEARVEPQPRACQYCHLSTACRVERAPPDDTADAMAGA